MNKTETQKLTVEKVTLEKTFTTTRKTTVDICRKGSVVKERCRQLSEVALNLFPSRVLSDDDLSDLIMMYIGADKETMRAYKGYSGHIRAGRCGDNHIVGLSRKGYLELFGFMHKIAGRRWVVHAQAKLSSQASEISNSGFGSKEKISLSLSGVGCVGNGSVSRESDVSSSELEEEEEASEKDRFFVHRSLERV
jgi:hypothetical protein